MSTTEIYWESQRGNMCRLHSLNAYFNFKKITEPDFIQYCNDYNQYIKDYYGEIILSQNYDIFPTYSLISYIIKRLVNKYCYFVPFNKLKNEKKSFSELLHNSKSFFVFNQKHIYLVKLHKNKWYKVDSLSGIVNIKLNQYDHGNKMGFIIPREIEDLDYDIQVFRKKILNFLDVSQIKTTLNVKTWVNNNFKTKLLDNMEVWLSHLNQIYQLKNTPNIILNSMLNSFYQNKHNEKHIHDSLPMVLKKNGFVVKLKKTKK